MKSVSLPLYRAIIDDKFQPVELLELRLPGSANPTVRVTSAGETLAYAGRSYQPCNFSHGRVDERIVTGTGDIPGVSVMVQNVTREMAALLQDFDLNGATCTLRMTDRTLIGTRDRNWYPIITGEIRNPQLSNMTLVFDVVSVLGQLERLSLPRRIFQKGCNYTFGSQACGVSLASVTTTTIAEEGTTDKYLVVPESAVSGAGADPTDFWSSGYVFVTSGAASLQHAPFHRYQQVGGQHRIYLRYPLRVAPSPGDTVKIRRGCRKTLTDCTARKGNTDQFGGFPNTPFGLVKPKETDHS